MHDMIRCAALLALCAGCTSSHPLPANYVPTQAAISAADAVGADHEPQGALHLKMARDQVGAAKSYAHQGKERKATLMLDRARVDAEMALLVAREATAANDASRAESRVKQLSPGE